ncbi:hypothetical protein BCR33DRAFT_781164 [Rhizoclosmatium globosum]|uniref:Uncharacterized protein n=1 Tax=Rhizoclosmatium globosum TaxID=329046 RepID=A0A1Y2CUD6_9FUNG|nr:hypothetical protein BCR33DRAFT_781164 [Rhizoclosmatium globosum]|eukprot:ORY50444.1 hypothetical protein BCR33DRAFT_781164 [Rhizoclosmatium globosum]
MSTTSISATASEIYRRILFLEAHAQVLSDQIDSISPVPTPDAPKMGLVALNPTTLVNLKADLVKLEHGFRFLTKDVAAELPGTLREALADSLMLQTIPSDDTETEALALIGGTNIEIVTLFKVIRMYSLDMVQIQTRAFNLGRVSGMTHSQTRKM